MLESPKDGTTLSKRAARRIIQRAFVLTGRDKRVRQHLREAQLTTLWVLEDWNLAWTVFLHRGRLEVARRPGKHPDLTLSWQTTQEFFLQAERVGDSPVQVEFLPAQEHPRFFQPLLRAFFAALRHVLSNPVDDQGVSLL
jgi:hypothetical protein